MTERLGINATVEEVVDHVMKQDGIDDDEIRSRLIDEVRNPTTAGIRTFIAVDMLSYFKREKFGPPPAYVKSNGAWIENEYHSQ